MSELPAGTVTFLFTDVEGSTRLWEEHPDAMKAALARHDEILRDAVQSHAGHIVKTTGDGVHAAFGSGHDAVDAAMQAQRSLLDEPWDHEPLQVRMGIHTGEAQQRDGDYYGTALNRAARLMSAGHGGQVLVSHATEELVRDAVDEGVELQDLGTHRLRDLTRPERVFQLGVPGLRADFPPIRSLDTFPGNLPPQLTSFVGRDEELAGVAKALDESRLVTLTGVGGVGKTRLAIQLAADVVPRFRDGAWLCELAAAPDEESMYQVIGAALGVRPRQGLSLEASAPEFLRAKQALIVLDNCEHLLGAVGRFAEQALQEATGVRIVATSREALAVAGEQVWPVRSLRLPDAAAAPVEAVESDAARLFVERACAARPDFVTDASTSEAIADVCRRLDGIPLAIELAAARVAVMSPTEIGARLDERFRLLTGGRRTAVERHQTLRAAVDWSYSMLEPPERLVFDRLAVFAGSFDASAADAVAAGEGIERWDVFDALAGLVRKSMLATEDLLAGVTRYQMLETMRQYGRERLDEAGQTDQWRRRHAEYYASLAEEIGPGLRAPDEVPWRKRSRMELDNLRAAVAWALDSSNESDGILAVRIIAALSFEVVHNRAAGIDAWAERALESVETCTPAQWSAVLAAAGFGAYHRGDMETAAVRADAATAYEHYDLTGLSMAYIASALFSVGAGGHDKALQTLENLRQALDRAPNRDAYIEANFHNVKAIFLSLAGRADEAREDAEMGVKIARKVGNPTVLAITLVGAGYAVIEQDEHAALEAFRESAELTRAGASDVNLANVLASMALVSSRRGERSAALRALREAFGHSREVGDRPTLLGNITSGVEVAVNVGALEFAALLAAKEASAGFVFIGHHFLVEYERAVASAREQLGAERYEEIWERGTAMSFDQVVDYALTELDRLIAESEEDSR
ncbi:MAG: adenylate/guanylate cyclase domain-containing protein [Actinomycetota bacterium]|nr:adenylate/guanylate cyclase domain-containing protein [Actinomycetota bacterium]